MKNFLCLVKALTNKKVPIHYANNVLRQKYDKSELLRLVSMAEVFVVSHAQEFDADSSKEIENGAPFDVCSFESTDKMHNEYALANDPDAWMALFCIVNVEFVPGDSFQILLLGVGETRKVHVTEIARFAVDKHLSSLSEGVTGIEEVNRRVWTGSNKGFTIKKVIHVRPKGSSESHGTKDIDWSHRWSVRGHWRKCNGLGKNRAGEYVISGSTWVTDHYKGPEDLPIVKKIRVVEAGNLGGTT